MTTAGLAYLCVRPQQDAAAGEYESFRTAMGLAPDELDRLDLTTERLDEGALERYAGFVVGGSPYNATDSRKSREQRRAEASLWLLAERAAAGEVAAFFTCYGIGVAARALGGEVDALRPEGTGSVGIDLTGAGMVDPVFGRLPDRFEAFTAHKENVAVPPPGSTLLATNVGCPIQAFRVGDGLYAAQFHPELTPAAFAARATVYRDHGYFPVHEFDEVTARILNAPVTEPRRLLRGFAERFSPARLAAA